MNKSLSASLKKSASLIESFCVPFCLLMGLVTGVYAVIGLFGDFSSILVTLPKFGEIVILFVVLKAIAQLCDAVAILLEK